MHTRALDLRPHVSAPSHTAPTRLSTLNRYTVNMLISQFIHAAYFSPLRLSLTDTIWEFLVDT